MKGRIDSKATSINGNVQQRSFESVLSLIQELFSMRLVQHLAMPGDKQKKLTLLSKFRERMNQLHLLLSDVQKGGWRQVETVSTKDRTRSRNGLQSKVQQLQKDQIKKIEITYNQFFRQGSFKYYPKIASVFDLPTGLQPIDIQNWARNCKNENHFDVDCCQCCVPKKKISS